MGKKYEGIRQIKTNKGNTFEVNFRLERGGKRYQFRVQAGSMQEAYLKRAELISQYMKKNDVSSIASQRQKTPITKEIETVIVNDLRIDKVAETSIKRFTGSWRTFLKFLKAKHPEVTTFNELKIEHFKDYHEYIVDDLNREDGWRNELTNLKIIIKRLMMRGYCSEQVLSELKPLKKPPQDKKEYSDIPDSDIKKLLNYIKKDRPDYYGITVFLYKCGWRIKETTLLRRSDIKWEGLNRVSITVRGETTKTKTTRVFDMIDDELAAVIRQQVRDKRKTKWLFPNRNNNPHSADHYREEYLKKVSKKVIGKEISPHWFRHRVCTIAGQKNMPPDDVRAITGIKDINVLLGYYQHSTREGREKILKLSSLE